MSPGAPPDGPRPGEDTPDDDPFAFPPDEHDAAAADGRGASGADRPAAGTARPRGAPAAPVAEERERAARVRNVAEEASRHAQAVGVRWLAVAAVVFLVVIGITTLGGGRGTAGGDVQAGERLPVFAAPLATRPRLQGNEDVNLATRDGQGQAGAVAACSIQNPSVVTSCALLRRGPLVLVLYSGGVADCVSAVDELDRLRPRFPGLQTLAVALLGEHDATARTVRDRRWTLPTAYDADGGLSSVLGAPACPLVLFVRPDGTVAQRIIGNLPDGALERGMRRLAAPAGGGTPTGVAPAPGR